MLPRRQVNRDLICELLTLKQRSITISAAFDTRMSGLITTDLGFKMKGVGSSQTMERIIQERLVPLCAVVALHMSALGIVPVRLAEAVVNVSDDPARKKRYGDSNPQSAKEIVPVIPHYTTWNWYIELDTNGELRNTFESTIDEAPVYAVKSLTNAGALIDATIASEMAILLEEWKSLMRLRMINQSSIKSQACPSVFIERKNQSTYSVEHQETLQRAADEIMHIEGMSYRVDRGSLDIRRDKPVDYLLGKIEAGKHFDIKDGLVQLPDEFTISTQPTLTPMDISIYEAAFEANVLAVFKVPASFFNGAKGGEGKLNDGQDTEQSENDRHQFKTGVDMAQRDITHFFKRVYAIITKSEIEVKLPAVTFSTLEELKQLYSLHVISGQSFREFAARHQGIHSDYIVDATGDLKIKQLEWEPPQKPKA